MSPLPTVDLPFPLLGLHRGANIRNEPPFTTAKAVNVRPRDQAEGRQRGGTRPGFQKAFIERLNTGPVQSLIQMNIASATGSKTWEDTFDGSSMLAEWSAPTFQINSRSLVLPPTASDSDSSNLGTARIDIAEAKGAVRDDFTDFDATSPYVLDADLFVLSYSENRYHFFLRMDNTTPDVLADGLDVELILIGDPATEGLTGFFYQADITGSIKSYVGGSLQTTYTFATGNQVLIGSSSLSITVDGDAIVVTYEGFELLNTTISESQAGRRIGFSMEESSGLSSSTFTPQHLDTFILRYQPTGVVDSVQRRLFTGIAGGDVFAEDNIGAMIQVTSTLTLRSDVTLQGIEHLSKLYIADYGEQKAERTDGEIDGTGLILDTTVAFDFADAGVSVEDHVVEIFDVASGAVAGVYEIDSFSSTILTLKISAGPNGTCSFRIERGPKIYDPIANTLTAFVATAGQTPIGYPQVTRYLDRLSWVGHIRDGRQWEQSRQGAPLDYDFFPSPNSIGRAVSGQNSEAGVNAAPITCQISHTDNYLVFASLGRLDVMRGDPTAGGTIDNLSMTTGIVGEDAFCFGPDGEIVFLARDGLYRLPIGARQAPENLSIDRLPRELRNIDPRLFKVGMEYDVDEQGVHIFVTPLESGTPVHFWFDWELRGFWSVKLALSTMEPFYVVRFRSDTITNNAVVFGCRDGYLRKFKIGNNLDDVSTIATKVYLGPFLLGNDQVDEGILHEIQAAMGTQSADALWSLYVDTTPEGVVNQANDESSTPFATGTFTAGLNRSVRPIARGNSMLIVIENSTNKGAWEFNHIAATVERLGRQKVV